MSETPRDGEADVFDRLLGELRPKLHRYCARMTGSVIDGEDVVQEALLKALEARAAAGALANPEGWLFRIAHNAALDHLRRRARRDATHADEDLAMIVDPATPAEDRQAAAASLATFMQLPAAQRSCVILMDVLGYTIQEVGAIIDATVPAVKAALHRGRARLRELAATPEEAPAPPLPAPERARLARYVALFNARDFDAIRDLLAADVRLDLVNRQRLAGRTAVGRYFGNYDKVSDWRLELGLVDRRPAILVRDPDDPASRPRYFILLEWTGDSLAAIRDFRYARYAVADAEILPFE
jgi:RNA polymerase sigma-70 factor (ECF subfamily)